MLDRHQEIERSPRVRYAVRKRIKKLCPPRRILRQHFLEPCDGLSILRHPRQKRYDFIADLWSRSQQNISVTHRRRIVLSLGTLARQPGHGQSLIQGTERGGLHELPRARLVP